jgi:hypothetical protein
MHLMQAANHCLKRELKLRDLVLMSICLPTSSRRGCGKPPAFCDEGSGSNLRDEWNWGVPLLAREPACATNACTSRNLNLGDRPEMNLVTTAGSPFKPEKA